MARLNVNTTDSIRRDSLNEIPDSEIAKQIKAMGEAVRNEPRVSVFIPKDLSREKQLPVYVGVNGYPVYIPRGKTVMIPYCIYTVLQQLEIVQ
jgi:hypothetical protein